MKKINISSRAKSLAMAFAFILCVGSIAFLSSCSGDEKEENPAVGVWVIESASLAAVTPSPVPLGPEPYTQWPSGTPVTEVFEQVLGNASPCDNPANTAVELTSDQKLFYVCIGETTAPEENGSWFVSSDGKTLVLSVLSNGITVPLSLADYTVSSTTLKGRITNFAFFPSTEGTPIPPSPFAFQTVSMDVEFTRVP